MAPETEQEARSLPSVQLTILGQKKNTSRRLNCEKCGKEFIVAKKRKIKGRRFCSKNCAHRHTYQFVKDIVESVEGYKLLDDKYINQCTKMNMMCSKGHPFSMDMNHFKDRRQRCPKCSYDEMRYIGLILKDMSKSYMIVKKRIESAPGYKLVTTETEYRGIAYKVSIMCPRGHIFHMTQSHFREGERCRKCYPFRNKNQEIMTNILKDIFGDNAVKEEYTGYGFRYKGTNQKMRFDAAIPELKMAFEYQGEQHFMPCSLFGQDANKCFEYTTMKDFEKREHCALHGITLVEIPFTWDRTRKYVESKIMEVKEWHRIQTHLRQENVSLT